MIRSTSGCFLIALKASRFSVAKIGASPVVELLAQEKESLVVAFIPTWLKAFDQYAFPAIISKLDLTWYSCLINLAVSKFGKDQTPYSLERKLRKLLSKLFASWTLSLFPILSIIISKLSGKNPSELGDFGKIFFCWILAIILLIMLTCLWRGK